jgi:hypothetical protein
MSAHVPTPPTVHIPPIAIAAMVLAIMEDTEEEEATEKKVRLEEVFLAL